MQVNTKTPYRILSLTLALVLLISSSGITMDMHFCEGNFKRASIFGKAKTCEQVSECMTKCGKETKACDSTSKCGSDGDHKGCCENETIDFDLDYDASEIAATELRPITKQFDVALSRSFLSSVSSVRETLHFFNYIPPPLEKDIAILFQVFRL